MCKPLLKWVGGKSQIMDEILKRIPIDLEEYYEPFLGGGSVLLALLSSSAHGNIQRFFVYDANPILISFYKDVQSYPQQLYRELQLLFQRYNSISTLKGRREPYSAQEALSSKESFYYWTRMEFNRIRKQPSIRLSALFIFLNKTCFRGLYREGPYGFNVPFGHYKRDLGIDVEHFLNVAQLLNSRNVVFECQDFRNLVVAETKKSFVYLDPPYIPLSDTSFVSYTSDGFDEQCHTQLIDLCKRLQQQKVSFMMSNSNVPRLHTCFENCVLFEVPCKRRIHSRQPDSMTSELLIINQ